MFKYILGLLLLALVSAGVYQHRDTLVSPFIRHVELIDEPAPDYFFVQDVDGKDRELGELRGKTSVIVLWATWCDTCPEMLKKLEEMRDQYEGKVMIVAMNIDVMQATADPRDHSAKPVAAVRDFRDHDQMTLPVWLLQGKGTGNWVKITESRLMGAEDRMPQVYVLDQDLRVRWFAITPYSGEVQAAVKQVMEKE
jgi:thiol-disulfide isomerase/thioredoxin